MTSGDAEARARLRDASASPRRIRAAFAAALTRRSWWADSGCVRSVSRGSWSSLLVAVPGLRRALARWWRVGAAIDSAMKRGPLRKTWAEGLALNRARNVSRAFELWDEQQYQEARQLVARVLREDPSDARAVWLQRQLVVGADIARAEALWFDARREEAVALLLDLSRRVPHEPEVHLRLAPMLVVAGDYAGAAEHSRHAAALAPSDPNVLFRAATTARWDDPSASRRYLEQTKALRAGNESGTRFAFDDNIAGLEGLLASDEGRPHVALAYLRKAVALQPEEPSAVGDLAEANLRLGRIDDAVDVITQGLQRHPGDERLLLLYNTIERADT